MPTTSRQDLALKLWVVLARAYEATAAHARAHAASHGLTLAEFGVMEALHHKGDMLLGELQRKILVTSGGVTYIVDRLVAKGMVERRECPEDRRARYAALTPQGKALMRRIFPEHAQWIEQACEGLSTAEQREAVRLLRDLGKRAAEQGPGAAFATADHH